MQTLQSTVHMYNHKFGEHVSVKAGRFNQVLGGGLAFDGTFDGAQFNAGNDKVNLQAAYGYGYMVSVLTGTPKLEALIQWHC